jgi:hypothetical protein
MSPTRAARLSLISALAASFAYGHPLSEPSKIDSGWKPLVPQSRPVPGIDTAATSTSGRAPIL